MSAYPRVIECNHNGITAELQMTRKSLGNVVEMNRLLLKRIAELEKTVAELTNKTENAEDQQNMKEENVFEADQNEENGNEETEAEERNEAPRGVHFELNANFDFEAVMVLLWFILLFFVVYTSGKGCGLFKTPESTSLFQYLHLLME